VENFGMKVTIYFNAACPFSEKVMVLRNVTEVHYAYSRGVLPRDKVAFESNIHGTGRTDRLEWIEEFEVYPETEKAEAF
jgi:hypothetical protein